MRSFPFRLTVITTLLLAAQMSFADPAQSPIPTPAATPAAAPIPAPVAPPVAKAPTQPFPGVESNDIALAITLAPTGRLEKKW